jgi:hypothetical protein
MGSRSGKQDTEEVPLNAERKLFNSGQQIADRIRTTLIYVLYTRSACPRGVKAQPVGLSLQRTRPFVGSTAMELEAAQLLYALLGALSSPPTACSPFLRDGSYLRSS